LQAPTPTFPSLGLTSLLLLPHLLASPAIQAALDAQLLHHTKLFPCAHTAHSPPFVFASTLPTYASPPTVSDKLTARFQRSSLLLNQWAHANV
jgi:hypothetical protein